MKAPLTYHAFATSTAGEVKAILLTPTRDLLTASGAWLHLWRLDSFEIKAAYCEHQGELTQVCYSPDRKWLATSSWDNTVILWDAATMQVKHRLQEHKSGVVVVAFSPDSQRLYSSCMNKQLIAWSVSDGSLLAKVSLEGSYLNGLLCLPEQLLLAGDGVTSVHPITLDSPKPWKGFPAALNGITQRAQRFYVPGCDGKLYWRDTPEGKVSSLQIHEKGSSCAAAVFFSDDDRVLTVGEDCTARLTSLSKKKELLQLNLGEMSYAALLHPNEESFFVANKNSIQQHNTRTGERLASFGPSGAPTFAIERIALAPAQKTLFNVAHDGCSAWSTETQTLRWGYTRRGAFSGFLLSSDGAEVFTTCVDWAQQKTLLLVLSASDGKVLREFALAGVGDPSGLVGLTTDTALVLGTTQCLEVQLSTGRLLATHAMSVPSDAWHAGHDLLAYAKKKDVLLWDTKSRKQVNALEVGNAHSFSRSDDGKTLIVGGWTGIISAWDLTSRQLLAKKKVSAKAPCVLWLQEGKVLVADQSSGMYLYDYQRNKARPLAGTKPASALLKVTPSQVVAGGLDGTCLSWELTSL